LSSYFLYRSLFKSFEISGKKEHDIVEKESTI